MRGRGGQCIHMVKSPIYFLIFQYACYILNMAVKLCEDEARAQSVPLHIFTISFAGKPGVTKKSSTNRWTFQSSPLNSQNQWTREDNGTLYSSKHCNTHLVRPSALSQVHISVSNSAWTVSMSKVWSSLLLKVSETDRQSWYNRMSGTSSFTWTDWKEITD